MNVVLDDLDIDYISFGTGKDVLVMIPGLSVTNVSNFANLITNRYKLLRSKYTVYLIDRRNNVPTLYSIKNMAEDTHKLLSYLGLKHYFLIGMSQGGMIAQEMAQTYQEEVKGLVLCATCEQTTPKLKQVAEKWINLASSNNVQELTKSFYYDLYSSGTLKNLTTIPNMEYKKEDLTRFIILTKSLLDYKVEDRYKLIKCPIYVFGSYGDKIMGIEGSKNLVNLYSAKYYYYDENYGHVFYDEAPDFVNRLLECLDNMK